MELIQAIALLCQLAGVDNPLIASGYQLRCQQYYVHCVSAKASLTKSEALEKCILEK